MSLLIAAPSLRIHPENPDHHLWNNHGTWFVHYTVHPTPFTKQRVRASLGTKHVVAARERRDAFFAHLAAETASGRTSAPPRVAVAVKQRFVLRKPDFLFDLPPPCGGLRSLSVGAGCLATKSRALS